MTFIRRFLRDLPLASKIAGFAGVLVFLIVPTLTLLTIRRESENFRAESEAQASLLLDTLSSGLRDFLYTGQVDEIQDIALNVNEHKEEIKQFKVYDEDGILVVDARQPEVAFPFDNDPLDPQLLLLAPHDRFVQQNDDELIVIQSVWIESERVGIVKMGFSIAPLNRRIEILAQSSITLAVAALAFSIVLAVFMARQLTNPITELTSNANKMAAGDLTAHFLPQGRDEIGQLGRAFNEMADAIEKREADLRNLAQGLEQAVRERTLELQQQNQYLGALNEVTFGLIENLEIERLLEAILIRAASLANTEHAFVNIVDPERGEMQRRVAQGRYRATLGTWTKPNQGLSGRVMATGQMMIQEDYQHFEDRDPKYDWLRTLIYVPLRFGSMILGVIGIGYDKVVPVNPSHVNILSQFAQLASLALKNAQLYSATQQELTETERALLVEEERHRTYLASPTGQAESMAENILSDPAQALITLRDLTQKAELDIQSAILPELPGVLDQAGQTFLARLAEGFHFINRSESEPELLAFGLRQLRTSLNLPQAGSLREAGEAVIIYRLCQHALEVGSIHTIIDMQPSLQALQSEIDVDSMFAGMAEVLKALLPVIESLYAYERVDTTEDRQTYLASAVERLSQVDRLAHLLHTAERPIALRIVQIWIAIVTGSMSDLQTRAWITCRLLTRHSWKGEVVTVALQLRNEGRGMALNLRVSLGESKDYVLIDNMVLVERLAPGEEASIELRVQPQLHPEINQFRAKFVILYDDPRAANHAEHFADIVHLLAPASAFQHIPNPYVAGIPLEAGSHLFFGREHLFNFIGENLSAGFRNNLVLIGQRRTGKSSLLKQLPLRLSEDILPVYLDGQSIALDPGMAAFFSKLAAEIGFSLQDRGFPVATLPLNEFIERPAYTFEHVYLPRVRAAIGDRHLVLLLDEFEELELAVKSGHLDASVFGFLRHLIQHESGLSIIFCGTHRMEELNADYWSVLFNISLYKHVGFLEYVEAIRLIQEPVTRYGMRYDDLALDKMWRITAGHPYFLQLLCHSMVNQHNRAGRSYVTVSDVNAALEEILSTGEAHFVYLWNESSLSERQVLTALSRMMPLSGRVTSVQIEDYFVDRGLFLDRQVISEALQRLTSRDILAMRVDSQPMGIGGTYSWRLGLLGLWIEKYKSLSLIQEEAHR